MIFVWVSRGAQWKYECSACLFSHTFALGGLDPHHRGQITVPTGIFRDNPSLDTDDYDALFSVLAVRMVLKKPAWFQYGFVVVVR